jgi:hypothetical protein
MGIDVHLARSSLNALTVRYAVAGRGIGGVLTACSALQEWQPENSRLPVYTPILLEVASS